MNKYRYWFDEGVYLESNIPLPAISCHFRDEVFAELDKLPESFLKHINIWELGEYRPYLEERSERNAEWLREELNK